MKEEYIDENSWAEPINYFPKLFFILWPMYHTKMAVGCSQPAKATIFFKCFTMPRLKDMGLKRLLYLRRHVL
jgi:hypothetical protein